MFLDSDANAVWSNLSQSDDGYMNHPGFIGGTWLKDTFQPGKAEDERYNDERNAQKADCNYAAGDSCDDLQDCKAFFQGIYNANTGNSRVPKRKRKAANYHMGKVNGMLAARDCDVQTVVTSAIDESYSQVDDKNEELAEIREQLTKIASDSASAQSNTFAKAQAMIDAQAISAAKEKKNLMIGGGAAVAILLLVVLIK